jgi:uncharacterized protein YbbC (DUF1343 family)
MSSILSCLCQAHATKNSDWVNNYNKSETINKLRFEGINFKNGKVYPIFDKKETSFW